LGLRCFGVCRLLLLITHTATKLVDGVRGRCECKLPLMFFLLGLLEFFVSTNETTSVDPERCATAFEVLAGGYALLDHIRPEGLRGSLQEGVEVG
jgi:hypothetical protein